ncbi:hypothetical protein PCE1_003540 [Barthelona sp. PCE]
MPRVLQEQDEPYERKVICFDRVQTLTVDSSFDYKTHLHDENTCVYNVGTSIADMQHFIYWVLSDICIIYVFSTELGHLHNVRLNFNPTLGRPIPYLISSMYYMLYFPHKCYVVYDEAATPLYVRDLDEREHIIGIDDDEIYTFRAHFPSQIIAYDKEWEYDEETLVINWACPADIIPGYSQILKHYTIAVENGTIKSLNFRSMNTNEWKNQLPRPCVVGKFDASYLFGLKNDECVLLLLGSNVTILHISNSEVCVYTVKWCTHVLVEWPYFIFEDFSHFLSHIHGFELETNGNDHKIEISLHFDPQIR